MKKKKQTAMDKLTLRFKLIKLMYKLEEKALKIPFKLIQQEIKRNSEQPKESKIVEVDRGSVEIQVIKRRFNQEVIAKRSKLPLSSIDWSVSTQSSIVEAIRKGKESESYQASLQLLQCQNKKDLVTQADINKFMEEVGTYSLKNTSDLITKQNIPQWQLTTYQLVAMIIIAPIILSLMMHYKLLEFPK